MPVRPPFLRSTSQVPENTHIYLQSTERMGPVRRLGKEAGVERIGVNRRLDRRRYLPDAPG